MKQVIIIIATASLFCLAPSLVEAQEPGKRRSLPQGIFTAIQQHINDNAQSDPVVKAIFVLVDTGNVWALLPGQHADADHVNAKPTVDLSGDAVFVSDIQTVTVHGETDPCYKIANVQYCW